MRSTKLYLRYTIDVHIFQKNILDQLRQTGSMRYSQLQPDDIESSHFKYHLNILVKDGLVTQEGRGVYRLTARGKSSVDRLSKGRVNPHITPKVITYTLLLGPGCYYLYRKDKEPYLGLVNMIGGKVHLGEPTKEAAIREVGEKTGLTAIDPALAGIAEIRISHGKNLLTHAVAFVYTAVLDEQAEVPTSLIKIPTDGLTARTDLAPDLLEIITAVQISTQIFAVNLDISWSHGE